MRRACRGWEAQRTAGDKGRKRVQHPPLEKNKMPEHFTKNTLECTAWCAKCQRNTQHRVDGGRRGPCIDPKHPVQKESAKQKRRREKGEFEKRNPLLF